MKKALIIWGGWDGHEPKETSEIFAAGLEARGFKVRLEESLSVLEDTRALKRLDLIVPNWTMGVLSPKQLKGLNAAVSAGVGLGGAHGGMGDAFRGCTDYEWMVGGHFVSHPHVGDYWVSLTGARSPITQGMKGRFKYCSEQYYMVMDPGVSVLAETVYQHAGKRVKMPVMWTKSWGKGRVFYSALGHVAQEYLDYPDVLELTLRGMVWAAEGKGK